MKKLTLILIFLILFLVACSAPNSADPGVSYPDAIDPGIADSNDPRPSINVHDALPDDMPWTELLEHSLAALEPPVVDDTARAGRTWYQVFVYSFFDSDGDGIGDLNGVTQRLDYIQSMGFDGIWLSPIHPSSTYHKYNVIDYYGIDQEYGTLDDFDALVDACNARGILLLLDLVINHSDLNHPWFTEHPEYYNIADQAGHGNWQRMPDGRYYECQFWNQMPDFDLENTALRAAFEDVFAFWLGRGVDGFRLDAAREFVSGNTEKNVEILSWLNNSVKAIKPDAYLVGEAWESTNKVYEYYESGIDSFFSFPFAGSDGAIAKVLLQSNISLNEYLQLTAAALDAAVSFNPSATNAPFFTNHDMARAAGFLRRDANLIKTAWGLSLMQPGNAFVYYGEEIGMSGSGRDPNKRAPMFWTNEASAAGMTSGPPEMEEVTHGFPPAVQQVGDPESIYTYVREAVIMRARYPHIGSGSFEVIPTAADSKSGAVLRTWNEDSIIVAFNVSSEESTLALAGTVLDVLSATGEQPNHQEDTLILPGYCIAILMP